MNYRDSLTCPEGPLIERHNMALNRSAVIMRFCLLSFPGRARLALRWGATRCRIIECIK